ncbi:MAG: hypothetical protein IPK72_01935 [Candidatus Eisenbacteria bacterium]|nr:hypothetical protein [Candidatus Eisenbacteria bacterium]
MRLEEAEKINATICDVLERLAFMFGDATDKDELPEPQGACFEASIRYGGASEGALTVIGPRELSPVLAANVLGLDPDDEVALARSDDAIKELLNVACGHLLSELAGDGPVFDLGAPTIKECTARDFVALRDEEGSFSFVVDDLPLVLRFIWKGTQG